MFPLANFRFVRLSVTFIFFFENALMYCIVDFEIKDTVARVSIRQLFKLTPFTIALL